MIRRIIFALLIAVGGIYGLSHISAKDAATPPPRQIAVRLQAAEPAVDVRVAPPSIEALEVAKLVRAVHVELDEEPQVPEVQPHTVPLPRASPPHVQHHQARHHRHRHRRHYMEKAR